MILTHHENQARPVLDDSNIYSDFNKDTKTTTLTDYNRSLIIVTNAETRRRKKGNTGPKSPAETDLRTSVHFRSGAKYAPSFRKTRLTACSPTRSFALISMPILLPDREIEIAHSP